MSWCRATGRAGLVELVRTGLRFDGGALCRTIAAAAPGAMREHCEAAITGMCRVMNENGIATAAAFGALLRSALLGAVANALLAQVVKGGDVASARVAGQLAAQSRIEMATALQWQRQADEHRANSTPSIAASWLQGDP